jgi:lipopolysaccharide export system permease protein
MSIIDRYYLRQFLVTALFALCAIIIIFIVIDMMENLDDFIDKSAGIEIVARYYLYFIPEIIKLMIPVAILLSALFTTGRMSTFNELTALKSSGVSLYRLMTPLLILSFVISAASIYFNGWVVPDANKKKFNLERQFLQKHLEYISRDNIFIQDSQTRILSIGYFDETRNVATRVSIQDFSDTNLTVLSNRYDAPQMQWDSVTGEWSLMNGSHRKFDETGETLEYFSSLNLGRLHFNPVDIRKKQEKPDEMSYADLQEFIDNQQRAGQNVSRWLVDFYSKVSFPFASVIVVLFGVPFSSIKRRSGLGVEFGIAVAISFVYMIFMKVSQAFGYNGFLDPLLTAWLANILFLIAGVVNLVRVPK